MPGFFSKVLGRKDANAASTKASKAGPQTLATPIAPPKAKWDDAWQRKDVEPEEVQELLRGCTLELKSRALDLPFLLLPFRPTSDPSAARTFIRNYFNSGRDNGRLMTAGQLQHELRLTEPMVLCSVVKWCWSRLPGGVVTWDAYELFKVGEQDADLARDAFATFIPLSVDSDARTKIIFDFFDLMAAVAAHGKTNGLGGRKLSRLAGWWAFEHADSGEGFEGGYKSWAKAADATSHLFFAYLRSLSPNSVRGTNGISALPISLQGLVQETEYPPETPSLLQSSTPKVVMIVASVSPTPFALLRRAKHFEYRDEDRALQSFADYEDPVQALTEECRRVLRCISSTNQSDASTSKDSTGLREASWSRFEDIGFSSFMDENAQEKEIETSTLGGRRGDGIRSAPHSQTKDLGRPTTPSWADFMSAGFVDEPTKGPAPLMLPPDKILPPIDTHRVNSSQSHRRAVEAESNLEPGELASITRMDFEDCFWWVWITSLAGEEPNDRKAVFGRCALIETSISGGRWLVMEEKVKGAAPPPEEGAYIVEKKSRFGLSKRGKLTRGKASLRKEAPPPLPAATQPYRATPGASKTSIGPDQHARIQAAAAILQKKQQDQTTAQLKRGRTDSNPTRTNSVFTLQPVIMNEAGPAMKWAHKFDKDAIREAYLGDNSAGKGSQLTLPLADSKTNGNGAAPAATSSQTNAGPSTGHHDDDSVPVTPIAADPEKPLKDPAEGLIHPVERKTPAAGGLAPPEQVPLPPDTAEPAAVASTQSTPEKKGKGNKLKKGGASGGLKKFFGKKKSDKTEKTEETASPESLKREETSSSLQTSTSQSALNRLSSFRNKHSFTSTSARPALPGAEDDTASSPVVAAEPKTLQPVAPVAPRSIPEPTPEPVREAAKFQSVAANEPGSSSTLITDSHGPVQSYKPEPVVQKPVIPYSQEPMPEAVRRPYQQPSYSSTKETEAADAAHAFSNFSHGPMDDVPAFVPEDSPKRVESPVVQKRVESPIVQKRVESPVVQKRVESPIVQKRVESPVVQKRVDSPVIAKRAESPVVSPPAVHQDLPRSVEPTPKAEPVAPAEPARASADSGEPAELNKETAPELKDRWAQIRANAAASRAAASQNKETATPSSTSDTSSTAGGAAPAAKARTSAAPEANGEETIESRVARIKARVAELTSNMDGDVANRPARPS